MSSDNYLKIRDHIVEIASKCGRNPQEITLVAVTKGVEWPNADFLYSLGQRDFGENRLHEAIAKKAEAPNDCRWHMIGTLQSNKVRKAIGQFALIHSVDSPALAIKIAQCSQEIGIITPILLQANTSGEISKHGLSEEEWQREFEGIAALEGIAIQGMMTMAPFEATETEARNCFARLRNLRDRLRTKAHPLPELSMGMSRDYPWAIQEGATLLRIGSAIF